MNSVVNNLATLLVIIAALTAIVLVAALVMNRTSVIQGTSERRRAVLYDAYVDAVENRQWDTVANVRLLSQGDPILQTLLRSYDQQHSGRIMQ